MKVVLEVYLRGWLLQQVDIEIPNWHIKRPFEYNIQARERILQYRVGILKYQCIRAIQNADEWILVAVFQSKARPDLITDEQMKEFENLIASKKTKAA